MQIPTGIGPERLDVAVVAFRFAAEKVVSTLCVGRIEAARSRLRRWYR
jgi:hypothetical protein